jgi:hypothetical protein
MVSCKKLRNAVYSTVQHSVSGLCFIHPHMGEACIAMGLTKVSLDLLGLNFIPELKSIPKELKLSSEALKEKFIELLCKQGIKADEIKNAYIKFYFDQDHWPSGGHIKVISEDCNIEHAVDGLGITAKVTRRNG